MKTLRSKRSIATTALVLALAAIGAGYTTSAVAAPLAVPTGDAAVDYRPSEWAQAGELAAAGKAPSLTNDVGRPAEGSGTRLPLGLGLIGLGVLGLVYGLAVAVRTPRGEKAGRGPLAAIRPPVGHASIQTRVRP